jgi:hypothetical protein
VQISDARFEVEASYVVKGMSLQEWDVAEDAFCEAMEQRLGFPVNVTAITPRAEDGVRRRRRLTSTLPLLDVFFTVYMFQDTNSTVLSMAEVEAIADYAQYASLEDLGSLTSIEVALLRSFPSNRTHEVQVTSILFLSRIFLCPPDADLPPY